MNIGRADKLGSGVRNLYKYTKIYSGGEPELIEGDVFKTIVPLGVAEPGGANGDLNGEADFPNRFPDQFPKTETQKKIFAALRKDSALSVNALAVKVGVSDRSIKQNIKTLREAGLLERIGSNRKGQWVVRE